MGVFAFLRHALRSVTRSRRRTLSSILGIVLAITMVAGVNIALDSTTGSILRGTLEQVPYDFMASGYSSDWVNVTSALEVVGLVEQVEPVLDVGWGDIVTWGTGGNYTMVGSGASYGVRPTFAARMQDFMLEGTVPTENGTVVLNSDLLYSYYGGQVTRPNVGDVVGLVIMTYVDPPGEYRRTFFNYTVAGFTSFTEYPSGGFIPRGPDFYGPVFLTIGDAERLRAQAGVGMGGYGERYFVWADRDKLVEPLSSETTRSNIVRMERNLQRAVNSYDVSVTSGGLEYAIDSFGMTMLMLRVLFIALSLPALILAVYLGSVGVEMGMEERRREIAIIKARGADSGHIAGLLVLEAIFAGIVAGVSGLVLGTLTSRFLLGSMISGTGASSDLAAFSVTLETVLVTIVLAVIFMAVASFRPIRQASKMPVAEGLHRYSETQAKLAYKPWWDVVMLILALVTFGLVFWMTAQKGGDPFAYFALMCILGPFLAFLVPVSPVFLILGVTRLLTRGTTQVYVWAAGALKPFTKDFSHLVKMNLLRNPRRASRICLLVAFGIAFGVLVSSMAESQLAYDERLLRAEIGADVRVDAYGMNRTFSQNLTAMPGVAGVVPVFFLSGESGESVAVFDADAYLKAVQVDPYFFTKGEPSSIEMLADDGFAIISQAFAETAYYDVADQVRVTVRFQDGMNSSSKSYDLEIVAVVKALPGLERAQTGYFPGIYSPGSIYVDFSSLPAADFNSMNVTNAISEQRFLIDVSGDDAGSVANAVQEAYPAVRTRVLQEEIIEARSDPTRGAVFQFLVIEIAFVVLIMSFGIGLVMYTATLEREVELGNIRARGASGRQLSQLMLGEAMSIVLIGVIVGLVTGSLTALMFNGVLNFTALFGGSSSTLDRPFVFGLQSFALVVIAIVSLIVAAIAATYRVRSMDISKVLRKRGG